MQNLLGMFAKCSNIGGGGSASVSVGDESVAVAFQNGQNTLPAFLKLGLD